MIRFSDVNALKEGGTVLERPGGVRLDVASERAQQLFTLFYLCYLLSDRWHINTPLSVLGLREEPAVLILCSKSPTVQDFTDV